MEQLTVVKEKLGRRYLQTGVALTLALPIVARAEGEATFMTPEEIKTSIAGIGMPALIGAAVVGMLTIAVLMWGGKRLIGFFSK